MKKTKVKVTNSLTYKPFENAMELLNKQASSNKDGKEKKNEK